MAGEVCIELVERDYVDANRAWMLRTLRRPGTLVRYALLIGGLAAFLSVLEWTGDGGWRGIADSVALALVGGGGALLVGHGLGFLLVPRRVRRIFRQTASLGKPWHYAWSDAGLGYRSDGEIGFLPWTDFYRWIEGSRGFLLMLNEQVFYIIPRRALTTAQAEDLRATAAAHGPPRF